MKLKKQEDRKRGICVADGCWNPGEDFGDGERSLYCGWHNDVLIEQANADREWRHYHPGEPDMRYERVIHVGTIQPHRALWEYWRLRALWKL